MFFEFYYTVSLNKVNLSGFIFAKKSALANTPTLSCFVFSVLDALTYSVSFRVWRFDYICLTVSFLIMPLPCAFTRTETREMALCNLSPQVKFPPGLARSFKILYHDLNTNGFKWASFEITKKVSVTDHLFILES